MDALEVHALVLHRAVLEQQQRTHGAQLRIGIQAGAQRGQEAEAFRAEGKDVRIQQADMVAAGAPRALVAGRREAPVLLQQDEAEGQGEARLGRDRQALGLLAAAWVVQHVDQLDLRVRPGGEQAELK
ncbi:MAG TPA: hypothetical protein VEY31_14670, partial [Roseococcus sp.]|nr:hypothetical protein [Roseococcus sp.]